MKLDTFGAHVVREMPLPAKVRLGDVKYGALAVIETTVIGGLGMNYPQFLGVVSESGMMRAVVWKSGAEDFPRA
jgi:hypothetical protein